MKTKILLLCSVVAGSFLAFSPADALTVHTPSIEITLKPGDALPQRIGLSDSARQGITVFPSVGSFADDAASASGMRLVQEPGAAQSWVFSDVDHLDLPADGSVVQLGVTIQVPGNAAPGAYALALLFSTAPTGDPAQQAFHPQDVMQIFLTVAGGTRDDVTPSLQPVASGKSIPLFAHTALWQADASFMASFKNTGNTFLRPYGVLEVQNHLFGGAAARATVNAAKQRLFPGASRTYALPDITGGAGFGKYTATLTTHYGSPEKTLTVTRTFWLAPPSFVITAAALFLFVCLLLMVWVFLARHRVSLARSRAAREKELRRVFLNPKTPVIKRGALRTKKSVSRPVSAKPARRLDGPQRSLMVQPKASVIQPSAQPVQTKSAAPSRKSAPRGKSVSVPPANPPIIGPSLPAKQASVIKKRSPRKRGSTPKPAA